jgi:hypothetical protein
MFQLLPKLDSKKGSFSGDLPLKQ